MSEPGALLHAGTSLPMALDQALAVLAFAIGVFAAVAYLFYDDHRGAFRRVER